MIARTLSTSAKRAELHKVAGKLAEFCQALYPLLVAHADDSGRQQGDVFTIKHAVDPTSPRSLQDFERALCALAKVGLIYWYEVDGRKYLEIHEFVKYQPGLKNRGNSKIPAMPQDAVGCREMPLEEKRTEQKRTEGKGTPADAVAAPLSEVPKDDDPAAPECKVEAVVQLWNELTANSKLPACRGLSETRRKHIRARMKEHGLGVLRDVFERMAVSRFATGDNDRGWVMTFDWLMESEGNFLKAFEGKYDNRALRATGTDGRGRTGAPPKGKYDGIEEHD